MTTATKIIRGAMDKLSLRGAGQNVNGTDAEHCRGVLNTMLNAMNLGPTFAFTETETVYALPANTQSLTIGVGQQLNISRPDRIEECSFIRISNIDYPLDVVDRDTYNAIVLKTLSGPWPVVCFWDGGNPTGTIKFWPQGACELHLFTSTAVGNFADLTTDYTLPNGYEKMFIYSLAEEIAPDFETAVPDSVARIAASARRSVRRMNLDVPQLDIPRQRRLSGQYVLGDFKAGL